jgi:uncharacterized membrane protein
MSDGLNEAITLLSSSNNLHYQIWMFYVVVAIGLLGFRFSETYDNLSQKRRLIIIIGFVGFSASNLIAMYQNMSHFNVVLSALQEYKVDSNGINFTDIFSQYHLKVIWRILGFQILVTILLSYVLYKPKDKI